MKTGRDRERDREKDRETEREREVHTKWTSVQNNYTWPKQRTPNRLGIQWLGGLDLEPSRDIWKFLEPSGTSGGWRQPGVTQERPRRHPGARSHLRGIWTSDLRKRHSLSNGMQRFLRDWRFTKRIWWHHQWCIHFYGKICPAAEYALSRTNPGPLKLPPEPLQQKLFESTINPHMQLARPPPLLAPATAGNRAQQASSHSARHLQVLQPIVPPNFELIFLTGWASQVSQVRPTRSG